MNEELKIENLKPIAVVDYETIDKIKEFVNLLLGLSGGKKTFDDFFEAQLVHNGYAICSYEDDEDYDDEDEDYDEDDEDDEIVRCGEDLPIDSDPPKKDWDWMSEEEKVDFCIYYAYECQDDTPIFPHVYITAKSDDVPPKLMEYMKKLVDTGINELCIGDGMYAEDAGEPPCTEGPSWY